MYMCKAVAPMLICALMEHARTQKKFSRGGGGGGQIPRRGLTENFNMAKFNNLALPGGGGSGTPVTAGFLTAFLVYEMNSFVHRILYKWPRCKKTFFCQGAFIL